MVTYHYKPLWICKENSSMCTTKSLFYICLMPRSHIHGSPRQFYYGLNLTDDPGNANFRSPIRMHYMRMIKYYYVWLRMQCGKLRTNTDCHEWCRIVSVSNPASSPWMCDLGITCVFYCQPDISLLEFGHRDIYNCTCNGSNKCLSPIYIHTCTYASVSYKTT